MASDGDPFTDLVGLWVTELSIVNSEGQLVLITEEHLDDDDPPIAYKVAFDEISAVVWDRPGIEPSLDTDAGEGRLESASRAGDSWTLTGGFGRVVITAASVRRIDLTGGDQADSGHWQPSSPALDLPHACELMRRVLETGESALRYNARFRRYSIAYPSDGSVQIIQWCPFCGVELPSELHHEWFARLDALGIDREGEPPAEMRDDRWWREAGL